MDPPEILVTGACGEMGHLLMPALHRRGHPLVAVDLTPLPDSLARLCVEAVQVDILDRDALRGLLRRHRPRWVFHLAAVLSSRAEQDPDLAHAVNVQGTVGLMTLCMEELGAEGAPPRFLFPSSIAAYGLPDAATKEAAGSIAETEWNFPSRVYGCNKIYCELLGSYYAARPRVNGRPGLDFRSIRFPGLISSETVPSGGTSDYAPEMVHAAARGEPYGCFVRAGTRLPFMTMTDAVDAFLALASAPSDALSRRVYNVRAFSPSAAEFRDAVIECFPGAEITFEPDPARQAIVDSWPADVDDRLARRDWGFSPRHGLRQALRDYLVPALRERYPSKDAPAGRGAYPG